VIIKIIVLYIFVIQGMHILSKVLFNLH